MLLNDDLSVQAIMHGMLLDWVPSPMPGVDRRMLFRVGEEKARATSIVRYAPGSSFQRHGHPGGEEFLVLEGVFQDESGDFPVGSYVRNPPGSEHAPRSGSGCTILVKLWQFHLDDRERVALRPGEGRVIPPRSGGLSSSLLFDGFGEYVTIEDWRAGVEITVPNPNGLELFVVGGSLEESGERCCRWSWLRLPKGKTLRAQTGTGGARVWLKSAALVHDRGCPFGHPEGLER